MADHVHREHKRLSAAERDMLIKLERALEKQIAEVIERGLTKGDEESLMY